MPIPIIDLHSDALYRMEAEGAQFATNSVLDTSLLNLKVGHVKVQNFAIFVSPQLPKGERLKCALRQIYYFYEEIIQAKHNVVPIKEWIQIENLQEHEIGAVLSIEGIDFFEGDLKMWHVFKHFGVLNIGLTWNVSNEAADSVAEDLGRGVTPFGLKIIDLNNEHKIFTDVSHLSEKSFWDIVHYAKYPIATHSNVKALCPNRRNLSDEQIVALIERKAPIHVVYNPPFVKEKGEVYIKDLINHIDYICSLGGKEVIGLGSDFDGINEKIHQLETAACQQNLINTLLKYYAEDDVKRFAYQNFMNNYPK